MADEIVEILKLNIDVESAIKDAQELKKNIDTLKGKLDETVKSEGKLSESYIVGSAQLKAYQQELRQKENLIQKTITATNAQTGSLNQLRAELAANTIKVNAMAASSEEEIKLRNEQVAKNEQLKASIVELEKAQGNYTGQVGNYEIATKSLKAEMKEMTLALIEMKRNGQDNTEAYKSMTAKLGEMKDSMSDVRAEVKLMGSDTKNIDMVADSIGSAAAAGQVYEGTMALVGVENEDVAKSIQKMVALQSIANGVQEVANALQKESGLMMGISAIQSKAAAAGQAIYSAAVGTSTGALKAFRIALLATGIGVAIAAIALLVANWDKLKSSIVGSTAAMDRYNAAQTKINLETQIKNKLIQDQIDLAKSQGKSDEYVAALEAKLHEVGIAQTQAKLDGLKKVQEAKAIELEQSKQNYKTQLAIAIAELGATAPLVLAAKAKVEAIEKEQIALKNQQNQTETTLKEQKRLYDNFNNEQKVKAQEKAEADKKANEEKIKNDKEAYKTMLENQATAMEKSLQLSQKRQQIIRDERLLNEGIYNAELEQIKNNTAEEAKIVEFKHKNNLISQQDYELALQDIVNKSSEELENLNQSRADAAIEQMNRELEIFKYDNQSKLKDLYNANDDQILAEQTRIQEVADKEAEYAAASITNEQDRAFAIRQIREQAEIDKQQLIDDYDAVKKQKAAEAAQADYDNEMAVLESTWFAKLDLQKKQLARQKAQEIENANKTGASVEIINKKYAKAEKEIDKLKNEAKLNAASQLAGNLATIFGEQSKIGKAAAVAATTISTIQSAQSAFQGMVEAIPGPVGLILGGVAAAAAAVSGYANVKKILAVNTDVTSGSTSSVSADTSSSSVSASSLSSEITRASSEAEVGQGIISRSTGTTDQSGNTAQVAVIVDEVTARQTDQTQINNTRNLLLKIIRYIGMKILLQAMKR